MDNYSINQSTTGYELWYRDTLLFTVPYIGQIEEYLSWRQEP
jgi:hypothetical protein